MIEITWEFLTMETLTVPAGTFEGCRKQHIRIEQGGDVEDFDVWHALGVGMVKWDRTSYGGDEWFVLLSADVGGTHYP